MPFSYPDQSISLCRVNVPCVDFYHLRSRPSFERDSESELAISTESANLGPKSFTKSVATLRLTLIKLELDAFAPILDFQPSYGPSNLPRLSVFQSITTNVSFAAFCVPLRFLHQQRPLCSYEQQVTDTNNPSASTPLIILPFSLVLFRSGHSVLLHAIHSDG